MERQSRFLRCNDEKMFKIMYLKVLMILYEYAYRKIKYAVVN